MVFDGEFLSLPGELRNEIYHMYTQETIIRFHESRAIPPAFARTCRQVRRELMSLLHHGVLKMNNFETRVLDFDFSKVLEFLTRLHEQTFVYNDPNQVRKLKIYIDVFTPAATYSQLRQQWVSAAQFDAEWYNANISRQVDMISDRRTPLRLKIMDRFYDVTHIIRFPPSLIFSVKQRMANKEWFEKFQNQFVRTMGNRAMVLNSQLERALEGASAREWVDKYWADYDKWLKWLDEVKRRPIQRRDLVEKLSGDNNVIKKSDSHQPKPNENERSSFPAQSQSMSLRGRPDYNKIGLIKQ